MRKYIALILILLSPYLYAEKTSTYLINVSKLNATYKQSALTVLGTQTTDKIDQPFKVTSILTTANTNYKLINITPSVTDKTIVTSFVDSGVMIEIYRGWVETVFVPRIGGYSTEYKYEQINDFPKDYYDVFTSSKSDIIK